MRQVYVEVFTLKSRLMVTAVLLAALVAAGCASKPKPADTSSPTKQDATAPVAAPVSATGKGYVAVTSGSSTSYSVREKFLGKELNVTAVGKTSAITGEIILEGGVIKPSVIQVDLSALKSDENRRDAQVRGALNTNNHKFATFKITSAEGNPVLAEGREISLRLQGNMTIKGTERPLVFDAKAKLAGDTLTLIAETTFKMTTFGVNPPSIAGFVSVTDDVKLDVTYVGKKQ